MTGVNDPDTVWVVTGIFSDDPHPHVLGVYDNEAAAHTHKRSICGSIKPSAPVAWGVTEMEVESDPLCEPGSRVDV